MGVHSLIFLIAAHNLAWKKAIHVIGSALIHLDFSMSRLYREVEAWCNMCHIKVKNNLSTKKVHLIVHSYAPTLTMTHVLPKASELVPGSLLLHWNSMRFFATGSLSDMNSLQEVRFTTLCRKVEIRHEYCNLNVTML